MSRMSSNGDGEGNGNAAQALKIGAILIGTLLTVTGVAFAAGSYPTRGEWNASKEKTEKQIEVLKYDVVNIKIEQVKLRSSLKVIENSQLRTEGIQTEIRQTIGEILLKQTIGREKNERKRRNNQR